MEENFKSVLEPIMRPLEFLRFFGGLPLNITFIEEKTKISFSWWQAIKMLFLFFILVFTIFAPQVYEVLSFGTVRTISF
jgi:hypothetical protein